MNRIRPNALGVIKRNNHLLAEKVEDKTKGEIFYRLMGGGIEFGELSLEALKREFKEELNATIINEKVLCTLENIFEFNSKKGHEITFLIEADLLEESLYEEKRIKILDKADCCAEWVPINEIKNGNIRVYPKEAVKYL